MIKKIIKLILYSCVLWSTQKMLATIRHVPDSYTTIQSAILASTNGDTVLVAPGTYFENLNFRGRKIVLTSMFYLAKDTSFICSTIINGSVPLHSDSASCIILNHNEDSTTYIQGFTITGGLGSKWADTHGAGIYREGGGVLTEFSSPVIRWNKIIGNYVINNSGVNGTGGGGIRSGDGHPLIYGNVIKNNKAGYGCGIVMNYSHNAKIKNNLIVNNSGGQAYGGGGIWCTGTDTNTVVYIENNTIAYNYVNGGGAYGGRAGGIFVFSIRLETQNNIIYHNKQSNGNSVASFFNGKINAEYSDIDFSFPGNGNLNSDPLFVDSLTCFLSDQSACIDAGNPGPQYNDVSTASNMGIFPSKGSARNDQGSYGGPLAQLLPYCNVITTATPKHNLRRRMFFYPNPIIDCATIEMDNEFDLSIYYTFGTTVFSGHFGPGKQKLNFEELNAGTYFVKICYLDQQIFTKIVIER